MAGEKYLRAIEPIFRATPIAVPQVSMEALVGRQPLEGGSMEFDLLIIDTDQQQLRTVKPQNALREGIKEGSQKVRNTLRNWSIVKTGNGTNWARTPLISIVAPGRDDRNQRCRRTQRRGERSVRPQARSRPALRRCSAGSCGRLRESVRLVRRPSTSSRNALG